MAESSRLRGPVGRASSITLRFIPRPLNKYEVRLEDGATGREAPIYEADASVIENQLLPVVRADLEKICDLVGGDLDKKNSLERVVHGLEELRRVGQTLLLELLGTRGANKLWALVSHHQRESCSPLRLELRTPMKWPIPFDILPLSKPPKVSPPSNKAELNAYARIFTGFAAITRHISTVGDEYRTEKNFRSPHGYLSSEKGIPCHPWATILYMLHDGAQGVETVPESLRALRPVVLVGPYPKNMQHNPDYLARLLIQPGWRSSKPTGGMYCQIVHIHAHALTGGRSIDEAHKLSFAYRNRKWIINSTNRVVVTNGHLATAIDPAGSPVEQGPFIFINACGGAAPSFRGGVGLAGFFLSHGYRALAGPVVSIDGDVAAEMAERFYKHLSRDHELGEALFLARHDLLNEFHNPLGVLYMIHGDSGLYIDKG